MAKYKFLKDYEANKTVGGVVGIVKVKYLKEQIVGGEKIVEKSGDTFVKLEDGVTILTSSPNAKISPVIEEISENKLVIQTQQPLESSNIEALKSINNAYVIGTSLGFAIGLGYAFKQGKSFWGYVGFGVAFSLIGGACFRAVSYFQNRKNL